jgi:hypothetical protein
VNDEEKKDGTHTIEVGDRKYHVRRFKGYKAFRLGRLLSTLGEIGPELSKAANEFITEYRSQNVDTIERATLEFRYPAEAAGVSDEAWKESGGVIKLANEPSQAEIMAVVFPKAFDLAGEKIVELLAWVVADDAKLKEKDLGENGEEEVQKYISELRRDLLFDAEVDQLLDLALAAKEVLGEQLGGKAEQARSLLALVGLDNSSEEEPESEESEEDEPTEEREVASPEVKDEPKTSTPSTPGSHTTSQRPDSSTDSQPPTDGSEETSSTDQAGALSPST